MTARLVTLRRSLQQAAHCLAEAIEVIDSNEDPRCAHDDVLAAMDLLTKVVMPQLAARARGAERGTGGAASPGKGERP